METVYSTTDTPVKTPSDYPVSEITALLNAEREQRYADHAAFVALSWPQCEEFRLARQRRFFEMTTRRVCPNYDCGTVWHTYESPRCPKCGSNRRERD